MCSRERWQGNEFRELEGALSEVVHRQKDPSDRNATVVIDRAIQTLKKDLAGKMLSGQCKQVPAQQTARKVANTDWKKRAPSKKKLRATTWSGSQSSSRIPQFPATDGPLLKHALPVSER